MTDIKETNDQDQDLDLKEILLVLFDCRRLIVAVTGTFIIGSLIYAMSLPNLYLSESLVVAMNDSGASNRASASVGSLVKMTTGIQLQSAGSMSTGEVAVATVKSRDFLNHLISNFEFVLPNIIAFKKFDAKTQSSILDSKMYDEKTKQWISGKLTYLEVYPEYRGMVTADYDMSAGVIYLAVEHESPIFAYDFLSLIIQEINSLRRERDLAESKKALDYLYKESGSGNIKAIEDTISSMITSQLNTQMMATIKPDYLIRPFDKPFIPLQKSGPFRSIIMIIGTLLGFILSSTFVIALYLSTGKKITIKNLFLTNQE